MELHPPQINEIFLRFKLYAAHGDNLDFHNTSYVIQNLKIPPRSGEFSENYTEKFGKSQTNTQKFGKAKKYTLECSFTNIIPINLENIDS